MVSQSAVRALQSLSPENYAQVRRRAIFECCKWDPQVEDASVLAPFPLVIDHATWRELAGLAEKLAAETLDAERELLSRPELHGRLGLPRAIRRVLRSVQPCAEIARVMRFDFHLTPPGWSITEVNSDVPGGFIEACGFTALMAETYPSKYTVCGDPARALAETLLTQLGPGALMGLVHATAYTDDRQVMIYLARMFEQLGLRTCLLAPDQLEWRDGHAHTATAWCRERADALVRFYPAEWLPNLPRGARWKHFFTGSRTPLCNPAAALLTQSKRFPLIWDDLSSRLPTWRRLLPETRDPRDVHWERDESWIVKPALGRVGESIGMRGTTPPRDWRKIARWVRWHPKYWVAQRRFHALSIDTDLGPVFPCLGVYTIGSRACGIYGRAAANPLVDHRARDVAVLVERDTLTITKLTWEPSHVERTPV